MSRLSDAVKELESAEATVSSLRQEIASLVGGMAAAVATPRGGAKRGPKPKAAAPSGNGRRGRPPGSSKGGMTLGDKCAQLLSKSSKGLLIKEIVEKLQKQGHETKAKSFPNVLYQTLRKGVEDKRFSKDSEKRYSVVA